MLGSGVSGIDREDPVARTERMRERAGGDTHPFGEKKSREELLEELKSDEPADDAPPSNPQIKH
jgi:hypothetical protein